DVTPTGTEYVFKHALSQEVAYNSLLIEQRRILHGKAGEALEDMAASQLDDRLDELAFHYRNSDNVGKAIDFLQRAGQRALQRSAASDALNNLNTALDLSRKLSDPSERLIRELALQFDIASALTPLKGWAADEVESSYNRARDICEQLGRPPQLFFVWGGLWATYFIRGEFRTAEDIAQQLLREAESLSEPTLLIFGHLTSGDCAYYRGHLLRAKQHLDFVISTYDPDRTGPLLQFGFDPKVNSLGFAGTTLWSLGYADQGLVAAEKGLALASKIGHANTLAGIQSLASMVHQYRRSASSVYQLAEAQRAVSSDHGLSFWLALANIPLGWALAEQGSTDEGIRLIFEGIARYRATGSGVGLPYHFCLLAEACSRARRLDEALEAVKEGLRISEETGGHEHDPELYRLKGELILARGPSDLAEAQECFEQAIAVGRTQTAKSWELRATTSLARLLAKQDRREEARAMLAEIYNWFTEGFDTADLKGAKALLDELSR
ncbi:MAG: hypothetical protein JO071_00625, partial [Deltaproteobacteria bacterium]|nr:hypothetical protein [Deltaproteobacteria bacterium]